MLENLLAPSRKSAGETVINVLSIAFGIIVLIFALSVLIFSLSFSRVIGDSMLTTIYDGEYILCTGTKNFVRGDIVTADADSKDIVKRIVAMPGERLIFVSLGDGAPPYTSDEKVCLYLDTGDGFKLIDESDFILGGNMTEFGFVNERMFFEGKYKLYHGNISDADESYIISMGEGEYFLMGDNRDDSTDSRNYGPFSAAKIKGKAIDIIHRGSFFYGIMNFIYSPFSCK